MIHTEDRDQIWQQKRSLLSGSWEAQPQLVFLVLSWLRPFLVCHHGHTCWTRLSWIPWISPTQSWLQKWVLKGQKAGMDINITGFCFFFNFYCWLVTFTLEKNEWNMQPSIRLQHIVWRGCGCWFLLALKANSSGANHLLAPNPKSIYGFYLPSLYKL